MHQKWSVELSGSAVRKRRGAMNRATQVSISQARFPSTQMTAGFHDFAEVAPLGVTF